MELYCLLILAALVLATRLLILVCGAVEDRT